MNRLAHETSPYLLQHAHNPVDWYPWGDEARERARAEDKPILLSVGYAACHWCHVMERESFEDEATARLMNERFVNVKVDREERPDVDAIYMQAVQALTGHGGWPMTVFLTPGGEPFYGGTYFPPDDRHGMPSFRRILGAVSDAWRDQRGRVAETAAALRRMYVDAETAASGMRTALSANTLEQGAWSIVRRYDPAHGGFAGAPKFPHAMAYDFLLRRWARTGDAVLLDQALTTFRRMARGGMYDQVGGGFHRYSVDTRWLVPHFEKMLYDNASLTSLGTHLWQATGDAEVARVVDETIAWATREMEAPDGGFYSTLDADSEGHEGKFYVWDEAELDERLGADAPLVKAAWGVTAGGNFEGRNIPHVAEEPAELAARLDVDEAALEAALQRARRTLYDARSRRVWPARDEKILASWNGLMIRAVAEAARAFGRDDWAALARRGGEFLAGKMVDAASGRVMRVHKAGVTRVSGFLEDHAAVGLAFLALHELTFERRWLDLARRVGDATVAWFWDDAAGAFYDTPSDHETLLTRPREAADNATPSGTSLAAELQLRLAELTGDAAARRRATAVLDTWAEPMARHGEAFGHLLGVADLAVHGFVELAIVGDPTTDGFRALARVASAAFAPSLALAGGAPVEGETLPLLAGRVALDGRATAYVCRGYTCEAPTSDPAALAEQLRAAVGD